MQRANGVIDDDQCRRVMSKFRKRRRERTSSIAALNKLRLSQTGGGGGIGRLEVLQNTRTKRRSPTSTLSSNNNNNNNSIGSLFWNCNSHDPRFDRRRRIEWGERLARKRAFGSTADQKSTTMPELVHRKPESTHTHSYYSGCLFLDSYDKVLAVDNRGTLDLVRLGDLRSQSQMQSQSQSKSRSTCTNAQRRDSTTPTTRSAPHHRIATNFELGANLQQDQQSFATAHLQALSGGSAVAFGLGDNRLCLRIDYATGRKRIASPVRFVPGVPPPHNARWDILEVRPGGGNWTNSLLYVAHVDSDYDAFWTQVLDGRARSTTAGRRNATTVLVDSTTRDHPGTAEEHITACAVLSDVCVATSHLSCGRYGSTPASEFFDRGLPYAGYSGMSSCVKLWDLRMVRTKPNPAMTKESPIPADVVAWSSPSLSSGLFQHADVAVAEPSATIQTRLTSVYGSLAFSEAEFANERGGCDDSDTKSSSVLGSDQVIINLSAARDSCCYGTSHNGSTRCGSLIVTTQSRTKSTRVTHSKLDLSGSTRTVRKISQTNSNLGCQPVYAISSSHNTMATCSKRTKGLSVGASTRLCLYDLNNETHPSAAKYKSASSERRDYSSPLNLRQKDREDPTFRYQIDASLTDRYGIDTELSCIAMNSNGTALLGGSMDGDLFVWRGI
eukprot:jgi/Psemu1/193645/e_gw1.145.59.1